MKTERGRKRTRQTENEEGRKNKGAKREKGSASLLL